MIASLGHTAPSSLAERVGLLTMREREIVGLVGQGLEKRPATRGVSPVDLAELGDYSNAMPNELSGGQRQRLALASSGCGACIMLMDEPLSTLGEALNALLRK